MIPDKRGNDEPRRSSDRDNPLTAALPDTGDKRVGRLDKEDAVILLLSIILVVAAIWLATRVL